MEAYKTEIAELKRKQLDPVTKTELDEIRSKIKEIVEFEGVSLNWLIRNIRDMRVNLRTLGGQSLCNYAATVHHSLDKDIPTPPIL